MSLRLQPPLQEAPNGDLCNYWFAYWLKRQTKMTGFLLVFILLYIFQYKLPLCDFEVSHKPALTVTDRTHYIWERFLP